MIFEGFHHHGLPRAENLACTVIEAFGDRFDFMVWYSDFRVDDQEAGTRSDGDIAQEVEGIGPRMDIGRRSADYCSDGRLQVSWHQPVWIGAVQAHEGSPDGAWGEYDRAMAQIAHEHGHRWSTRSRAIVGGDTIELRGDHLPWAMSGAGDPPFALPNPSPFPYGSGPHEGSIMGGGVYQDNGDGTFTVLDRGSMQPSSGYSYLELYFIGVLAPEDVPRSFCSATSKRSAATTRGGRWSLRKGSTSRSTTSSRTTGPASRPSRTRLGHSARPSSLWCFRGGPPAPSCSNARTGFDGNGSSTGKRSRVGWRP